jgi:hypothetical protein
LWYWPVSTRFFPERLSIAKLIRISMTQKTGVTCRNRCVQHDCGYAIMSPLFEDRFTFGSWFFVWKLKLSHPTRLENDLKGVKMEGFANAWILCIFAFNWARLFRERVNQVVVCSFPGFLKTVWFVYKWNQLFLWDGSALRTIGHNAEAWWQQINHTMNWFWMSL